MMKWFFSLLLLILCAAPQAKAEQKLFKADPRDAHVLNSPQSQPQTVKDYANLYYRNCMAANTTKSMKEYVATQCACTAFKIPEAMTLEDLHALFDANNKDSYYFSRLMALAYAPCLEISVHDFAYDGCIANVEHQKMRKKPQFCECVAGALGQDMSKFGETQIPGYQRKGYDLQKVPDNPFPYVINSQNFQTKSKYNTSRCLQNEEYSWR
jgi:hypothetical protein